MKNTKKHGHFVFCTYYTRKDGTRVYAKAYGKKAFCFFVED